MPIKKINKMKNDVKAAESIINQATWEGRKVLSSAESKAILSAFHIPVSETIEAATASEAVIAGKSLGFPVAMKINSPDITHKQDVGGVQLNLKNAEEVQDAFNKMKAHVKAVNPKALIRGVTLERMYQNANYRELMIGVVRDKVFGPVIAFGLGGSLIEVLRDRAVALPPLNIFLAKELIGKTKASKLLGDFRGKPPVDMDLLIHILLQVSDLILALPQIQEMDINPLLIDDKEAVGVDVRIVIKTN